MASLSNYMGFSNYDPSKQFGYDPINKGKGLLSQSTPSLEAFAPFAEPKRKSNASNEQADDKAGKPMLNMMMGASLARFLPEWRDEPDQPSGFIPNYQPPNDDVADWTGTGVSGMLTPQTGTNTFTTRQGATGTFSSNSSPEDPNSIPSITAAQAAGKANAPMYGDEAANYKTLGDPVGVFQDNNGTLGFLYNDGSLVNPETGLTGFSSASGNKSAVSRSNSSRKPGQSSHTPWSAGFPLALV